MLDNRKKDYDKSAIKSLRRVECYQRTSVIATEAVSCILEANKKSFHDYPGTNFDALIWKPEEEETNKNVTEISRDQLQ